MVLTFCANLRLDMCYLNSLDNFCKLKRSILLICNKKGIMLNTLLLCLKEMKKFLNTLLLCLIETYIEMFLQSSIIILLAKLFL